MTQTMEVLAPVGGAKQLLAAVRAGADAVYLGAKGFNARQNATNFEEDGLLKAVSFCHARGVRVYVTVNTLVTDAELPALLKTLEEVSLSGADGVIVQDLAVARLVRERIPGIELHASTQMSVHNVAGAKALESLGFSRVVLARELTLDEIHAIHTGTGLLLEVFVHGALCMSVSGMCYLSAMLGGRSGNRGLCAQPCRLDFRAGDRPYALSLKDLSATQHLDALRRAGVHSLKIEGRMKGPEYVAAAVQACRAALSGEPYDLSTLRDVFSRGGFTDGYLTGKRNLSMFGVRSREDIEASRKVQGALAALYRHERPAVAVDMRLSLRAGAPSALTVTDGARTSTVSGDVPQAAVSAPTDLERARRSLSKTGNTPFFLRGVALEASGPLTLPASAIGALRRRALENLLALREAAAPLPYENIPLPSLRPHTAAGAPALRARVESAAQLVGGLEAEKVILPLAAITPALLERFGPRLVAELPALLFPLEEEAAQKRLHALRAEGLQATQVEGLGALRMAGEAGLLAHGGYGLNITNSLALDAYARLGLEDATVSIELHAKKLAALGGGIPRGAIAYGYLPLMRLRCCPAQGRDGCRGCGGHPALTDRKGLSFPLLCHGGRCASLLNAIPLDLAGTPLSGADFYTLYFTTETAAECRRILTRFRDGEAPEGPRTRGLYFRSLQ